MTENDEIKFYLEGLPNNPGIYKFIDKNGDIIYIGKAKNIKKRVGNYFVKSKSQNNKIHVLVKNISKIEYTIVENESDALLLENNLIKEFQPKYNVQLKDDKTFPWICVKNEPFPRVFMTRKFLKDGSKYYGPYTSAKMVRTILDFMRQIYKTRTCNFNLSKENICKGKFKVCLEYHIGNCEAPCVGYQTLQEYNTTINGIEFILKGNINKVIDHLEKLMKQFSFEYRFEEAENIKLKINLINRYKSKSTIVNPKISDVDVFCIIDDEKHAYVNYLKVINGAILQTHSLEMLKRLNDDMDELLALAITDVRQKLRSTAKEIIVPSDISSYFPQLITTIPQKGDKKKLLNLAERNAKQMLLAKLKQGEQGYFIKKNRRILETMKKDLQLHSIPDHIECFDNSNIIGTNPVASCVVFRNGKPSKSEYRHYNIKTVSCPDDYASMEEIVFRRYSRIIEEKKDKPKLIIVDGGKGQLNAALQSLDHLNLKDSIPIIGIAKRLEEIYFPGDSIPIYLDKNSETLKLIQKIRNEAHRFGIKFHRDKRSKEFIRSELDEIKGIGEKTKQLLFERAGSVNTVKSLTMKELEDIVGASKARIIHDYFN